VTTNLAHPKNLREVFRVSLRDEIWNAFAQSIFITEVSLAMKLATSSWPNVLRDDKTTARGNRLFTWRPVLNSSNRFSRT
jgi:hypothetical protein